MTRSTFLAQLSNIITMPTGLASPVDNFVSPGDAGDSPTHVLLREIEAAARG